LPPGNPHRWQPVGTVDGSADACTGTRYRRPGAGGTARPPLRDGAGRRLRAWSGHLPVRRNLSLSATGPGRAPGSPTGATG